MSQCCWGPPVLYLVGNCRNSSMAQMKGFLFWKGQWSERRVRGGEAPEASFFPPMSMGTQEGILEDSLEGMLSFCLGTSPTWRGYRLGLKGRVRWMKNLTGTFVPKPLAGHWQASLIGGTAHFSPGSPHPPQVMLSPRLAAILGFVMKNVLGEEGGVTLQLLKLGVSMHNQSRKARFMG